MQHIWFRERTRRKVGELLLTIAHLTFMRCMIVHSVSTREVGSLPPSLSSVCEQDGVQNRVSSSLRISDGFTTAAGFSIRQGMSLTC